MKFKVTQFYYCSDSQIVEADSEQEAIDKCSGGDGWKNDSIDDYQIYATKVKPKHKVIK